MFDQVFYTNTLLNTAFQYLERNQQRYGPEFSNLFINDHDLGNGQQTHNNARHFFDYAARAIFNMNGTAQATDEQLWKIVGTYVEEIFQIHTRNTNNRMGGGGFSAGGFGQQSSGFGQANSGFGRSNSGFGNNSGGGFGMQRQQRPGSSSSLRDDTIVPPAAAAVNVPQVATPAAVAPSIVQPMAQMTQVAEYSHNPLDGLSQMKDDFSFTTNTEKLVWGIDDPADDSIVIMRHTSYKTDDQRFVFKSMAGFNRVYTKDEMDIVKDFFRVAPQSFLAENFIFEVFYNHVEVIDVPTKMFLELRDAFLKSLTRESTAYRAVITVLDSMLHGPRMAAANYLVNHINRSLHKCCRMAERPSTEIRISQIEDLEELLGTNFHHSILEVPNARTLLQDVVNNTIRAALSGYSSPMFTSDQDKMMSDIIRTSSAFPFAIEGVYPTKILIPSYGDTAFASFYKAFSEKVLEHKTYVRSIRSVVITNTLGGNELPKIGRDAVRVHGSMAYLLSRFKTQYGGSIGLGRDETEQFDERFRNDIPEQDYEDYITDPLKYVSPMKSLFAEMEVPRYPVDRSLYAIQFKKSPLEYIKAIDFIDSFNEPRERNSGIFAQKTVKTISPVK